MALSKIDSVALGANAVANSIGYQPMGNTSGSISTALGYTPMGNSSGSVTGALGFTPANKAGDTITGATTFSNTVSVTGVATFSNTTTFASNGALILPTGTTAQRPGSPTAGMFRYNTSLGGHEYYNGTSWTNILGPGQTPATAGLSAKDLQNQGVTADGVYYVTMHGTISATQHYCLMDTAYDGGGWTLLMTTNDGNGLAAGTNYAFSVTTGTPSIQANYGLDRRNTFTPVNGDQFLIRREDTNDWVRFVVTTWSPTVNNIANKWETTKDTNGNERGHPYWALGQMYNSSGSAVSSVIHFNGCALGGNCGTGGGDGAGFGTYIDWLYGVAGYRAWGGGFNGQGNGGSPLFWDTTNINGTRLTYWYRKAGSQ